MRTSGAILSLVVVLVSAQARADGRACVMTAGKNTADAAAVVERELAHRFTTTDAGHVASALQVRGHDAGEVAALARTDGPMDPALRAALAADSLGALAFILGARSSVRLILFNLSDGRRALDTSFRLGRKGRVDVAQVGGAVQQALQAWPQEVAAVAPSPPPAPGPAPVLLTSPSPSEPERDDVRVLGRLLLGVGGRQFSFHQPISPQLRDYSLLAAPTVTGEIEAYPLRNLGALVRFGISPELGSRVSDTGERTSTSWYEWQAGARFRLAFGAVTTAATLTYGQLMFAFGDSGILASDLPSVRYANARIALASWFPLGPRWLLHAEGGYRQLFSIGALGDRFPHATAGGFDATLGTAYALSGNLSALVEARYEHFFQAFHPLPGDAQVAGGALDMYPSIDIGLQHAF